jgi:hypothetical protein
VVGPGPQRELLFGLVTHDCDRAEPECSPQLDGGGPDAAGGPVDQQGFAWLGAAPPDQGQQAGQVVQGESRPGLQAQVVGQGQHALGRSADGLLPAAGRQKDGDPLAGGQAQVGPGGADGAGGVHARGERQGHLELVGPGGLEQVGERHPGRNYVDDHPVVGRRLLDLGPLDRRWAREGHDRVGEHRLLPRWPGAAVSTQPGSGPSNTAPERTVPRSPCGPGARSANSMGTSGYRAWNRAERACAVCAPPTVEPRTPRTPL